MSALHQVGYLTGVSSDVTASLGHVGASGAVRVYTALRNPPLNSDVLVAEPVPGCFVVYSLMV